MKTKSDHYSDIEVINNWLEVHKLDHLNIHPLDAIKMYKLAYRDGKKDGLNEAIILNKINNVKTYK